MENSSLSPLVANVWGSVAHISIDLIFILLLFAGLTALSFYFGKSKSVALIISSYLALFLFSFFPFLKSTGEALITLSAFSALWAVIFFIVKNVFSAEFSYSLIKKLMEAALLALSLLIVIFVASYHFLPIAKIYQFSSVISPLFGPTQFVFYWLIFPIIVIFFTVRK